MYLAGVPGLSLRMDQSHIHPHRRWIYHRPLEDIPVTFQVGMVGSDGVVLASDRCYTRHDSARSSYEGDKIFVAENKPLALCAAGEDISEKAI